MKKSNKEIISNFAERYKKAMVTGGSGFIGSHICEELLKIGVEVISIDDFSAGKTENIQHLLDKPNFSSVKCDITDYEDLSDKMAGVDIIFHNAASKKNICLKDPRRDLQVNAEGTLNILDLSKQYNVKKVVHASTGSVYGEPLLFPQDENHPLQPVSYYGVSKLAGDRYVEMYNKLFDLDTSILRYYHVFGPRQESNEFGGVVSIFIRNMINGENPVIFGDGTQERSFTYVEDIVKANLIVALDSKATGEAYNCASGISISINDLCYYIIEKFGKKNEVKPIYEDWLIGDVLRFQVDNTKIKKVGVDFRTDFYSLLDQTIDEMKTFLG